MRCFVIDFKGVFLFSVFVCLLLAGCDAPPSEYAESSLGESESDAFYGQPHWSAYRERAQRDGPFEPARSEWERVEALENIEGMDEDELCASPASVVQAWAEFRSLLGAAQSDSLDVSIRSRELEDSHVEGLLQRWGFKDDSLAGIDHRLRFSSTDDGCLRLQRVEARHYCRRGIDTGARCL